MSNSIFKNEMPLVDFLEDAYICLVDLEYAHDAIKHKIARQNKGLLIAIRNKMMDRILYEGVADLIPVLNSVVGYLGESIEKMNVEEDKLTGVDLTFIGLNASKGLTNFINYVTLKTSVLHDSQDYSEERDGEDFVKIMDIITENEKNPDVIVSKNNYKDCLYCEEFLGMSRYLSNGVIDSFRDLLDGTFLNQKLNRETRDEISLVNITENKAPKDVYDVPEGIETMAEFIDAISNDYDKEYVEKIIEALNTDKTINYDKDIIVDIENIEW